MGEQRWPLYGHYTALIRPYNGRMKATAVLPTSPSFGSELSNCSCPLRAQFPFSALRHQTLPFTLFSFLQNEFFERWAFYCTLLLYIGSLHRHRKLSLQIFVADFILKLIHLISVKLSRGQFISELYFRTVFGVLIWS